MLKCRKLIKHFEVFFFLVFLMLISSGCASLGVYNSATGKKEFIVIPTAYEVSMGRDMHNGILKKYKLTTDQALISRVERIGASIASVSDRQDYSYHFYVIESEDLNAFTTPGGYIYLFTGLAAKLNTDEEIAAVLSHEVGHCAARHTIKKFQAAVSYNIIGDIIFSQLDMHSQVHRIVSLSTNTVMKLVFSAYSRQDEYEADRLGIKYMDLAGYDLKGIVSVLEILKEESKGKEGLLMLRSHPYLDDRIAAVTEEMKKY